MENQVTNMKWDFTGSRVCDGYATHTFSASGTYQEQERYAQISIGSNLWSESGIDRVALMKNLISDSIILDVQDRHRGY